MNIAKEFKMGNSAVRFLAFGLGVLLLFHGIYVMIHGTAFIREIILDFYAPYIQNKPCDFCIGGMMVGKGFMETMLTGSSISYEQYIAYVAYGVYLAELIAPILLIVGKYIKVAATIIAVDIFFAMILKYHDKIFTLGEQGAWSLEVPMLYFIVAITLILSKK